MSKEAIEQGMAYQINEHMARIVEGEELASRISLMKARDYAIALMVRTESAEATDHAIMARDVSDSFLFTECSIPKLAKAVWYCRRLVQCAMDADDLERA